jgi:hypothetical protein
MSAMTALTGHIRGNETFALHKQAKLIAMHIYPTGLERYIGLRKKIAKPFASFRKKKAVFV